MNEKEFKHQFDVSSIHLSQIDSLVERFDAKSKGLIAGGLIAAALSILALIFNQPIGFITLLYSIGTILSGLIPHIMIGNFDLKMRPKFMSKFKNAKAERAESALYFDNHEVLYTENNALASEKAKQLATRNMIYLVFVRTQMIFQKVENLDSVHSKAMGWMFISIIATAIARSTNIVELLVAAAVLSSVVMGFTIGLTALNKVSIDVMAESKDIFNEYFEDYLISKQDVEK